MRKNIEMTLEDGSRKAFPFEANGATAILYRMVFHEDLMVTMNNLSGANMDTLVGAKLAYIMNAQSENTPTSRLSMDSFIHWAAGFDGMSLIENLDALVALYIGNRAMTSETKKEDAQLTGK
jgi:hypothetical protein